MKTITAIIPAYNEEKNIERTLYVIENTGIFNEIICVNDGSKDSTKAQIKKHKKVKFIDLKKNRGKGYALSRGIAEAKSKFVALIDADLTNLHKQHLQQMIDPILQNQGIDVVVGYEYGKFISIFSGQRVYFRKDLLPIISEMKKSKYGVEVLLNAVFRNKVVKYVQLSNLGHIDKISKFNMLIWFYNYFSQWFIMVLSQVIKYGITKEEFKSALEEQGKIITTKFKETRAHKN